jgi:hypothetical protein
VKKHLGPLAVFAAGIVLGIIPLATPAPKPADAPGFSAARAREDILRVAAAPHTVWDQASLVPVRDHLRSRLAGMGLAVATYRYPPVTDAFGHSYPLENIAAAIPGKSGRSILLVSHYDSSPKKRAAEQEGSRGAADDGYGIATMLEIARVLAAGKDSLENGVRFLFTDAEETGLHGAGAEMTRNLAAYADVDLVVNLEARGVKGPAVLFETGRNNLATLRLYRNARRPFAYSFAVDVYRRMPNGTDLTLFLQKGFAGLNFAVLDDLSYYHTPRDNPDNISLGSLQHYGEQILPVVLEYSRDPRYGRPGAFAAAEDMVYFTWLPGILVSYPATAAKIISILTTILFVAWTARALVRKEARIGSALLWFLAWLGMAALALGIGLGTSVLLAKATGIPWKVTYMPGVPFDRAITWVLVFLETLVPYLLASRRARKGGEIGSLLAAAMALNLVMLAVFHRFLPGGSFMFALPLLAALAGSWLASRTGRAWIVWIPAALSIGLFLPILHLVGLALTIGALGIVTLLAFFPLTLAGPLLVLGRPAVRERPCGSG